MDNIIDGKQVETITTHYDNGQIHRQWQQTDYELHGFHKEYYESGMKKAMREYRNNKIHKVDFAWYENGQLKKELKQVESNFFLIQYEKDGAKIRESETDTSGKPIGISRQWYSNGNLKSSMIYDHEHKQIGTQKIYFENGQINSINEYLNGETIFHQEWNTQGNQMIKDGEGELITYTSDGKIASKVKIKNGRRNGIMEMFDNGKLKCRATYIDGKTEGQTIWYYPNGKVKEISEMRNGIAIEVKRNFPMFDNPLLKKEIIIKPSEYRDSNNKKIIPTIFPRLMNKESILNSINLEPSIYNGRPQELRIVEVYRVTLTEKGGVKEFTRSSGSGYPVSEEIEKTFELMKFDLMNQRKEGIENQIWIRFEIWQIEKESCH